MVGNRQRGGVPLSSLLLAIGVASVLLMLVKPTGANSPALLGILVQMLIGAVPGGILAVIVAVYCSESWSAVAAGYFVGSAATVAAVRMLIDPPRLHVAVGAAALLIAFGLAVRFAQRKPDDAEDA